MNVNSEQKYCTGKQFSKSIDNKHCQTVPLLPSLFVGVPDGLLCLSRLLHGFSTWLGRHDAGKDLRKI